MADDGVFFSWKVWKVQRSNPHISTYHKIRKPLPEPKNLKWIRDEITHEWSLMPKDRAQEKPVAPSFSSETPFDENQVGHVFEHVVLPTDTFSGLCLRYRTTATKLRQLNRFSGTNLKLAPAKLLIPVTRKNRHRVRPQDRFSREFLVHLLLAEVPELRCRRSSVAYLSLAEWDPTRAIEEASSDLRWEDENKLRLIETSNKAKPKQSAASRDNAKTSECRDDIGSCLLGLQKGLKKILRDSDELVSKENDEWLEMKEFTSSGCPGLDSVSETSSVTSEDGDCSMDSLTEGRYMVQCRFSADSSVSIDRIVENLSDTLPSNCDMLKTKISRLFHREGDRLADRAQDARSVEMQCLIGKKTKQKIH